MFTEYSIKTHPLMYHKSLKKGDLVKINPNYWLREKGASFIERKELEAVFVVVSYSEKEDKAYIKPLEQYIDKSIDSFVLTEQVSRFGEWRSSLMLVASADVDDDSEYETTFVPKYKF